MKYIYRGFELSSDGNGYGAQLLVWHDKVAYFIPNVPVPSAKPEQKYYFTPVVIPTLLSCDSAGENC